MSIDFGNWAFRNNKLVYFLIAVLVIGGAYSAYRATASNSSAPKQFQKIVL